MVRIDPKKLSLAFAAVLTLYAFGILLNFGILNGASMRDSPYYAVLLRQRAFLFSPATLAMVAVFVAASIRWSLVHHKREPSELERLAGLSVALVTILSMLFTYFYTR